MTRQQFKNGSAVECVAPLGTRNRDRYGHRATVVSWFDAENCYQVEFNDGVRRIIHAADLHQVQP